MTNQAYRFAEPYLRAPEELDVHIQHAYGTLGTHRSNSTVLKNIFFSLRNFIFSEPSGELNVVDLAQD